MGNVIRLTIARFSLALSTLWRTTKRRHGRKPPSVLLILGAEGVGKTTIAGRILHGGKWKVGDETYIPTKGFSILQANYRGSRIELYDLGGSASVRELWTHYYPDSHGIIFVIDPTKDLTQQREIFIQVLQDERVKRKPIMILLTKSDLERVSIDVIVSQLELIELVNNAKCLTRVDLTSRERILDNFQDGLMVGLKWITTYVKWHWTELAERVERDTFVERSKEKPTFGITIDPKPTSTDDCPEISTSSTNTEEKSSLNISPEPEYSDSLTPPPGIRRLDPEGGNEKEWIPDAKHQVVHHPDTEDELLPEFVLVESKAEVHFQRPRSDSAMTLHSTASVIDGFVVDVSLPPSIRGGDSDSSASGFESKVKTANSQGVRTRPKLFRNKTAPIPAPLPSSTQHDQPIRIPLTLEANNMSILEGITTNSVFQA